MGDAGIEEVAQRELVGRHVVGAALAVVRARQTRILYAGKHRLGDVLGFDGIKPGIANRSVAACRPVWPGVEVNHLVISGSDGTDVTHGFGIERRVTAITTNHSRIIGVWPQGGVDEGRPFRSLPLREVDVTVCIHVIGAGIDGRVACLVKPGRRDTLHARAFCGDVAVALHDALVPIAQMAHTIAEGEHVTVVNAIWIVEPSLVVDRRRSRARGSVDVAIGRIDVRLFRTCRLVIARHTVVEKVDGGVLGVETRDHMALELIGSRLGLGRGAGSVLIA